MPDDERSIEQVIAEVREDAEDATPGPWEWQWLAGAYGDDGEMQGVVLVGAPCPVIGQPQTVVDGAHPRAGVATRQADAAFIVAACNNAMRLCDEIERLTRELDGWHQATAASAGIPADVVQRAWRGYMSEQGDA